MKNIFEAFEDTTKNEIRAVGIFDFDSTLFDSPLKPRNFRGDWWASRKTLEYEYFGYVSPEYVGVFIDDETKSKIISEFNKILESIELQFQGEIEFKVDHVTIKHFRKVKEKKKEIEKFNLGESVDLIVDELFIVDEKDFFSAAISVKGIDVDSGVPHITIAHGGKASARDSIDTVSGNHSGKNFLAFDNLSGLKVSGTIGYYDNSTKNKIFSIPEFGEDGFTDQEIDFKGLANKELIPVAQQMINDKNSIAFVVTGRVEELRKQVERILREIDLGELASDDFLFMNSKPTSTLSFKTLIFRELISAVIRHNYENGFYDSEEGDIVETGIVVDSYDDREEDGHVAHFQTNVIDLFVDQGLPIDGKRYTISPASKSHAVKI